VVTVLRIIEISYLSIYFLNVQLGWGHPSFLYLTCLHIRFHFGIGIKPPVVPSFGLYSNCTFDP
jgi:hypothetical protein